jgi:hypothetical protein
MCGMHQICSGAQPLGWQPSSSCMIYLDNPYDYIAVFLTLQNNNM